jgi:hypothetical protein
MPAEPQAQKEEKPLEKVPSQPVTAEPASEFVPQQGGTVVAERAPEAAETVQPLTQSAYGSILDRFRGFQGDRTPESMTALFDKPVAPDILQEPAIVISDGKATARVSLDLAVSKGSAANISLIGVTLINLKNGDEKGRLVIDVQPLGRVSKASVTIFTGRAVLEYPVTVVPPAESVTGSRTDFAAFLRDSGAKAPKFDLNGDGRHDYQDDYIYTAHYLLAPKAPVKGAK